MSPFGEGYCFEYESCKWRQSFDEDTRLYSKWEEFEKLFSNKWIKDINLEELHKIQDELKEAKDELQKKGEELFKIQFLNEACMMELHKLKQEKNNREKWGNDKSRDELKNNNEENVDYEYIIKDYYMRSRY